MNRQLNARELERWIDRLVDGEISDDDRRALLLRLDEEPGGAGWRRCALAFLESREWRGSLSHSPALRKHATLPIRPAQAWAMAASVALAFWLGSVTRRPAPAEAPAPPEAVAEVPTLTSPSVENEVREAPIDELFALDGRAPSGPWSWPGELSSARVPELPAAVIDDWRRRGYEVESRPRVVSINGEEGRQAQLPVNEVRVRYVGDRTY